MSLAVEIGAPGVTVPPFASVLEQAVRNEEKGYSSMWWPDHLMGWFPDAAWTPDVVPMASVWRSPHTFLEATTTIAAVAAATRRMKLGTSVTEAIRRHPAVLAQTAITLDHISKGRIILGIGAGEAENIVPYGLSFTNPVEKMREAVHIIRMLWQSQGKHVDFQGKFWSLEKAVFHLPPYDNHFPPIWIAANSKRTLQLTGQVGDGWLPAFMPPEEYSEKLQAIRASAVSSGRDGEAIVPALWAETLLDEDHDTCEKLLDSPWFRFMALIRSSSIFEKVGSKHPLGEDFSGFRQLIPTHFSRPEVLQAISKVPKEVCRECFLYGTPEEVINKLEKYVSLGLKHVVLWNYTFFADPSRLRSSFRCMEEILHHFKQ